MSIIIGSIVAVLFVMFYLCYEYTSAPLTIIDNDNLVVARVEDITQLSSNLIKYCNCDYYIAKLHPIVTSYNVYRIKDITITRETNRIYGLFRSSRVRYLSSRTKLIQLGDIHNGTAF